MWEERILKKESKKLKEKDELLSLNPQEEEIEKDTGEE